MGKNKTRKQKREEIREEIREKLHEDVDFKEVNKKAKGFWKEFRDFAVKGNVIDLATGMVIGSAFTSIVNSLVKDILTPLIGALTGGMDYSNLFISLDGVDYETLEAAQEVSAPLLMYGNFINAIINFLIVALFIFIVFKKILGCRKKKEVVVTAEPTEKDCPYCKSKININATRCPHCTSEVE